MGFCLKLWFSPFWFFGEAEEILEENRENLLKDKDGNPITAKKGSYACTIPPNSCRLYRIAKARPHPWLLSTDMHIQQGAVELESLHWHDETKTLAGTITRPAGERGNLFFLIPRHLKLINHEKANTMREVLDMQTVVRLPVEFKNERETFELRFEPIDTKFIARKNWLPYATEKEWLAHVEKHRDPSSTRVIE